MVGLGTDEAGGRCRVMLKPASTLKQHRVTGPAATATSCCCPCSPVPQMDVGHVPCSTHAVRMSG